MDEKKLQILNSRMKKLLRKYGKLVFGFGNTRAEIMLVGEAPGRQEEIHGRPFVGRAGIVLNSALKKAGIKRGRIYISNVIKFRPPKNRKPKTSEVREFLPFLLAEIEILKPRIVCLLGNTAVESLIGGYPVTQNHGKIVKKGGKRFLITFHPAAILRNPNLRRKFERDIRKLKRFLP